jgi:hypothetical protein
VDLSEAFSFLDLFTGEYQFYYCCIAS